VFHADWPVRIEGDEHGDVEYALAHTDCRPRERAALKNESAAEDPR